MTAGELASPAERYEAARVRHRYPQLREFRATQSFELDDFQDRSCRALEDGYGVLVCAPTGAGKTVVGEFAAHLALAAGQKCFYTTPIKALSNQKFAELSARYGEENVGLLTGDNSVNSEAPIVVMTTEVLRNMLYVGSRTLTGLGYVVMDEVHYLGDRFRGAVWEEVIIHLSASVRLVSLSATVSNAEEFGEWLVTVRGDTVVVVHEQRPVPLWQHVLVGGRLYDLFAEPAVAGSAPPPRGRPGATRPPDIDRALLDAVRSRMEREPMTRRGRQPVRARPPARPDIIDRLERAALLPAIVFVFSRAGCDGAVRQCVTSGMRLVGAEDADRIRAIAERRTAALDPADLQAVGYYEWLDGLLRGFAAHHAGLLPAFKEAVEELFEEGLVRVVFATETLALGINMPARTVVLERLVKYNGETHAQITPGEYTQLTGRAGRRGIDVEGHAVVVWTPEVDPEQLGGLASTRTYPLRSSFRPSYNMAVNLVGQLGRDAARTLLESSFAQFQADRSVVGLARQVERGRISLRAMDSEMRCDRGDFVEYARLRRKLSDHEKSIVRSGTAQRRAQASASLERLRIGDVVQIPSGKHSGYAVVLDPGLQLGTDARPLVLTESKWAGRVSAADFTGAAEVVTRVRVPKNFNHRSAQHRKDLASSLRNADLPPIARHRTRVRDDDPAATALRAAIRVHPCHQCPDREEHARAAERMLRLEREIDTMQDRVRSKTNTLARHFDRVCTVLDAYAYLDGNAVTENGQLLARLWSESDLLAAQCIRAGVWSGLSAPELAAVVSSMVFEARRDDAAPVRLPGSRLSAAADATIVEWAKLLTAETEAGLAPTRRPDFGFATAAMRWTGGDRLEQALVAGDGLPMPAGDFVRTSRQVLDLLEQIAALGSAGGQITETARLAATSMRRGVVGQDRR